MQRARRDARTIDTVRDELVALLADGYSYRQVAQALAVPKTTVWRWAQDEAVQASVVAAQRLRRLDAHVVRMRYLSEAHELAWAVVTGRRKKLTGVQLKLLRYFLGVLDGGSVLVEGGSPTGPDSAAAGQVGPVVPAGPLQIIFTDRRLPEGERRLPEGDVVEGDVVEVPVLPRVVPSDGE